MARRIGVAVGAAVLVLAAGAVALAELDPEGSGVGGGASPTRQVGIGRVAVEVPASWSANRASCNSPFRDTWFFPFGQDCIMARAPQVSSVAITTGENRETGTLLGNLDADGTVEGHEVRAGRTVCESTPDGWCRQTFGVPDLHAWFTATLPQDGEVDATQQIAEIRRSLTVLPEDRTTIPFTPWGTVPEVTHALEAAGLKVRVEHTTCPATAGCISGVARLEPAVGSVVPTGTTVTVTVLD